MIDTDSVLDEVVSSVQSRLAEIEMQVADMRAELIEIRTELDASRGSGPDIVAPSAPLEDRVARLERRLDSVDVTEE